MNRSEAENPSNEQQGTEAAVLTAPAEIQAAESSASEVRPTLPAEPSPEDGADHGGYRQVFACASCPQETRPVEEYILRGSGESRD